MNVTGICNYPNFIVSELLIVCTLTRTAILNPPCLVKFVNCLEGQKPGVLPSLPNMRFKSVWLNRSTNLSDWGG